VQGLDGSGAGWEEAREEDQGQAGPGRLVQGQACGGGRTSQASMDDERGGLLMGDT
jgi:hypothetical protein